MAWLETIENYPGPGEAPEIKRYKAALRNHQNHWLPLKHPDRFIAALIGSCFHPWTNPHQCRWMYAFRMGVPVSKIHTPPMDEEGYVTFEDAATALRNLWKYFGRCCRATSFPFR